ncbi:hypothetical protein BH11ACT3_BH11ACT3_08740 [soil metagenome]
MNTVYNWAMASISSTWPGSVWAITLFVDDLAESREFYERLGATAVNEDDVSVVFTFGETLINLLQSSEAPELISPVSVSTKSAGTRAQYTILVDDTDATYAQLTSRGITFLNGPIDRPWGPRTAAFQDPAGNVWELAQR